MPFRKLWLSRRSHNKKHWVARLFRSRADVTAPLPDFRVTPMADIDHRRIDVRFVPRSRRRELRKIIGPP